MQGKSAPSQPVVTTVSFLLVSCMLSCLAISIIQLGESIMRDWQGDYLVWLVFFVSLEGLVSQRRMVGMVSTATPVLLFRAAEWVVILSLLKVAHYISAGFHLLRLDLPLWQEDFYGYFFTSEYMFGMLVLFLVWVLAIVFSNELAILDVTEKSLRAEVESGIYEQRPQARERLANLFLGLGIGMVFLVAALRSELLTGWFQLPAMRSGVMNLLVYFLLGLVLLSLTQFNLLRVSWLLDHLPVQKEIASRWFIYSFIFILLVAMLAAWLPTSYSLGLISMLRIIVFAVSGFISMILSILIFPFILLFNLLMGLLSKGSESAGLPEPKIPSFESLPASAEQVPILWLEVLKSILFWSVFLAVIGFSLVYYLREHQELLASLRQLPVFSSLASLFNWLRQKFGRINQQVSAAVDQTWQRLIDRLRRPHPENAWRFLNLRKLTHRGQVFFYYLALLRRGAELGFPRAPSQTPFEYAHLLSGNLQPPAQEPAPADQVSEFHDDKLNTVTTDISSMTAHFVEARYSLHEVTDQDVSLVRRYWARLRKILRRISHPLNRDASTH